MSDFSEAKLSVDQAVQAVTQLFLKHESGLIDEAISKLHEVESLIQKAESEKDRFSEPRRYNDTSIVHEVHENRCFYLVFSVTCKVAHSID